MRKLLLFLSACTMCINTYAQTPTMQEKLYYTCKVWGFVKYYHSEVSVCNVNWDSVLLAVLPDVRSATTSTEFNDALMNMLNAAGPMALSTTYFPDTLAPELKRNRDWSWISTPTLRSDVQTILDTIKNNFRPHPICHVDYNTSVGGLGMAWGGYLKFPPDTAMINMNIHATFPNQDNKLLMLFTLWNITHYFNPYNYVLTTSWDTTLYNYAVPFGNATNVAELKLLYLKIVASLDDSHVYGFSYVYGEYIPPGYYPPRLKLKHVEGQYVVIRSMEPGINPGDAIISIDGLTILQWEDSLMQYYSAGSPWIKRRIMSDNLLKRPSVGTPETIVCADNTGTTHTFTVNTVNSFAPEYSDFFYDYYYPADSLNGIDWTIFDCNVGYMNFGNITDAGVDSAYDAMYNLPGMVLDIRNYPISGNAWALSDKLYAGPMQFVKLTMPDVEYPGTYYWMPVSMGIAGNPTPYLGKLVVIVDEVSQSAAEYTTMMLRKVPGAVVIGSNTAGADGNITYLQPAYDMRFGWTSLGVFYPNGDSTQRIGIVPDTFAYPTKEGVRNHRDYVLEKALAIAGCGTYTGVPMKNKTFSRIMVYPNPADESITINIAGVNQQNITASITDIYGKTLLHEQIGNSATLYISSFSPGMYFVTVSTEGQKYVTKVVKR